MIAAGDIFFESTRWQISYSPFQSHIPAPSYELADELFAHKRAPDDHRDKVVDKASPAAESVFGAFENRYAW